MRINSLKIAGFRGFNEERTLLFNDELTVISAPNSHGKTSISEAMEFLLYGSTSKVDDADAKDEYKDSYRNRHFPSNTPAYIQAEMAISPDTVQVLRIELDANGTVRRYIDDVVVPGWSLESDTGNTGRPFVLQHALKNLLLAAPVDRFKGFALLLGLNEVDDVSRAITSLCTKASSSIPEEAVGMLDEFDNIGAQLGLIPSLKKAAADFIKGPGGVERAYKAVSAHADTFLPVETNPSGSQIERLKNVRTSMTAKVYSGEIAIKGLTPIDNDRLITERAVLTLENDPGFLDEYGRICVAAAEARLQKEANLLQLGSELIGESADVCPLCLQKMDAVITAGIHKRHTAHQTDLEKETGRKATQEKILRILREVSSSIARHQSTVLRPVLGLLEAVKPENEPRVVGLLGGADSTRAITLHSTAASISAIQLRLNAAKIEVDDAIDSCETSIRGGKAELPQAERLARVLNSYVTAADEMTSIIPQLETSMSEPSRVFRQAIDGLAGTAEISSLIEILGKQDQVQRAVVVREVIDNLKILKKNVEQTLAETMDAAMGKEMTDLVMKWYTQIKTDGDPDVHFSGFAMDKTKAGDFKSGKLTVKAESYGVPLASAVSSLSESKLNALGLCVNIASAIRKAGPWSFLLIDDPIQSWDDQHEDKFVDVLRGLIDEEGKQIIVLTHKGNWADRVCDGCRSINGYRYDITGYDKKGPNIIERNWAPIENRIKEVNAILGNVSSPAERIQQADEELRLIACQLAQKVAKEKLDRTTSVHNMSATDVRNILTSAGAPVKDIDDLYAVQSAADDAHHTPAKYQPNVQRVRTGINVINRVKTWLGT